MPSLERRPHGGLQAQSFRRILVALQVRRHVWLTYGTQVAPVRGTDVPSCRL